MAPARKRPKQRPSPKHTARASRRATTSPAGKFVGRDPSPVLERYPPKDPRLGVRGPPSPAKAAIPAAPVTPSPPPSGGASATPPPLAPLISLEVPFDVDEFAQMLGETSIEVKVPREDLAEVLRRISDFMGFGIYVYRFSVRPAPSGLLKEFVVELTRVDYSPTDGAWTPFVEKGRSESPFGPDSTR
ncbi:MAG: hypothetical protein ACREBT_03370 [Thermoplasmata archaeon]